MTRGHPALRVHGGILQPGDSLWALDPGGDRTGKGKVRKIFGRRGSERIDSGTGVNVTLVHPEGWASDASLYV